MYKSNFRSALKVLLFVIFFFGTGVTKSQTICITSVLPDVGPLKGYRRLYQNKLFVTEGTVARYVFLPGLFGT